jgi:D-3-phosphoglycerate dehydrogenase / 2-oxoglutarate reductase
MSADFGTVSIAAHYRQIPNMDFEALLPHLPNRIFHDEWNVPETWPAGVTVLVNDVMYATPALIDRLPNLKVISFAGTGVWDRVDVAYATRRGVAVCNVSGWGNDSIAEFTFTLLLALAKKLFTADAVARRAEWQVKECYGLQLHGKTIGLIGLGNIGQRVAEIAEGFGLRVLCYTRRPHAPRRIKVRVEFVPLDELLRRSDFLSLHALLTDETRGMIGARELDLLPEGAIVINTARGPLIDTDALVAALKRGRLRGAGLDVFHHEPLPERHPLKELDNVILSPHASGLTDTAAYNLFARSLSNADAFAAGDPVNVVNPEVLRQPR